MDEPISRIQNLGLSRKTVVSQKQHWEGKLANLAKINGENMKCWRVGAGQDSCQQFFADYAMYLSVLMERWNGEDHTETL